MADESLDFMEKFRPAELEIHRTTHWIVTLRPKQITIGSSVITARSGAGSLGELDPEAAADLPLAVAEFERRLSAAYGAEKFNYIAAMMKDPFVHFHALPRYAAPVEALGRDWPDVYWPAVAGFDSVEASEADLFAIRDRLRDS